MGDLKDVLGQQQQQVMGPAYQPVSEHSGQCEMEENKTPRNMEWSEAGGETMFHK